MDICLYIDDLLSPVKDSTYLRLSNSRAAIDISEMVIKGFFGYPYADEKKACIAVCYTSL